MSTPQSDSKLLELAAKAAGYVQGDTFKFHQATGAPMVRAALGRQWVRWNPRDDDGDAMRLAVRLELDVGSGANPLGEKVIMASHAEKFDGWFEELRGPDPYAATRRAIVRAAAEIGMAMP